MSLKTMRYEFGKNWKSFNSTSFSEKRLSIAKESILDFLNLDNLEGKTFLDIGSGSGLQSFAAYRAGADKIYSFDYDRNSVAATKSLWIKSGEPKKWKVGQGSVLDENFMLSLGKFDIIYSWGVLHHTGNVWKALENSILPLKKDGVLYIALYAEEAYQDPPPEYWLNIKQNYNNSGCFNKKIIEIKYVFNSLMKSKITNIIELLKMALLYKKNRGMSLWTDIKDWLGGWPMEFTSAEEVYSHSLNKLNLCLINLKMGNGCTEYLFKKKNVRSWNYYSDEHYDYNRIECSIFKSFNHYFEEKLITLEKKYGGLVQRVPQTIKSDIQPKIYITNSDQDWINYLCQGGDRMKSEYHYIAPLYSSFLKNYICHLVTLKN